MKTFWTVLKNQSVIDAVSKINSRKEAYSISTSDFFSPYNNINHVRLKFVLQELSNSSFKGGSGNYIFVMEFGARWADGKKNL